MTFAFAAVSAFSAGVFFHAERWPQAQRERGARLLLRFLALTVMVASAFGASSLFGTEGSIEALGIAAAVLWLPHLLLLLVFDRGTTGRAAPRSDDADA